MPRLNRIGRLDGWKAICEFLGVSRQTAWRWRRAHSLPVGNFPLSANVYAYISDLQLWLRRNLPRMGVQAQIAISSTIHGPLSTGG